MLAHVASDELWLRPDRAGRRCRSGHGAGERRPLVSLASAAARRREGDPMRLRSVVYADTDSWVFLRSRSYRRKPTGFFCSLEIVSRLQRGGTESAGPRAAF